MRKLVFMLKVNIPGRNSFLTKNLDISTHKGSRISIEGNRAEVLDVTDDPLSDSELLQWYKARYSGFGMSIRIIHDDETKVESVAGNVAMEPVKIEVEKPMVEDVAPVKVASEVSVDPVVKEPEIPSADLTDMLFGDSLVAEKPVEAEVASVSKVEPKSKTGTKADEMTYFEMIQFAKDHGIEVSGRAKGLYVEKLAEWFKNHD